MENIADLIKTMLSAFGKLSIIVYMAFVAALVFGYHYRASLRRSKFVEYVGNVSPDDDEAAAKTKTSRSARVSP